MEGEGLGAGLPKVKVREDLVLRDDAYTGWAIRKNSPQLVAALEDFYKNFVKKHGIIEQRFAQFNKRIKQISNNTGTAEWQRFEDTLDLFEKYGAKYGFDPLMLAAQGYQEPQLDQNAKSHVGNNVELMTAEKIGIETTTYVRNIYKYYTAYKLQEEVLAARRKAREQLAPVK